MFRMPAWLEKTHFFIGKHKYVDHNKHWVKIFHHYFLYFELKADCFISVFLILNSTLPSHRAPYHPTPTPPGCPGCVTLLRWLVCGQREKSENIVSCLLWVCAWLVWGEATTLLIITSYIVCIIINKRSRFQHETQNMKLDPSVLPHVNFVLQQQKDLWENPYLLSHSILETFSHKMVAI